MSLSGSRVCSQSPVPTARLGRPSCLGRTGGDSPALRRALTRYRQSGLSLGPLRALTRSLSLARASSTTHARPLALARRRPGNLASPRPAEQRRTATHRVGSDDRPSRRSRARALTKQYYKTGGFSVCLNWFGIGLVLSGGAGRGRQIAARAGRPAVCRRSAVQRHQSSSGVLECDGPLCACRPAETAEIDGDGDGGGAGCPRLAGGRGRLSHITERPFNSRRRSSNRLGFPPLWPPLRR